MVFGVLRVGVFVNEVGGVWFFIISFEDVLKSFLIYFIS